ncbi:MAG: hypothetical protein ACI8TS_000641, partial [Flavobacteriales bacterium]
WEVISPDLSRNDPGKLVSSGGPITKDNTGVEYYATIFAAEESPYEKDLIWCGSDDGLIHVSRDGGKEWQNVTPKELPEWTLINSIEVDPFQKGGLYVAATRYKLGDYQPYLYHTIDYGKSWRLMTTGIAKTHFTRVIRADRSVKGLLYCGTEFGMYISKDNGAKWMPFQLNLPQVPITDMALKDNDLIVATQGRSFWVLDDLNILWDEVGAATTKETMRLFSIHPTVGYGGGSKASETEGTNHPAGVQLYFNLPETSKEVELKFMDAQGELIRTFSTKAKEKSDKLEINKGMNVFNWDTRYEKADEFEGLLMWFGTTEGPTAPPGSYSARLVTENDSAETTIAILLDPRMEGSLEDRQAQFDFLLEIRNKVDETHDAIRHMRMVKKQIKDLSSRLDTAVYAAVIDEGKRLDSLMLDIEKVLYQTKLKSNQDMLNYPIRLNNKLAHTASLASIGIYRPTDQMIGVKDDLTIKINVELEKWYAIRDQELRKYNAVIRESEVDVIGVGEE